MRGFMNRACNQLFSGAGLAGDQHGFAVAGDAVHHSHEFVHHWTGKNKGRAVDPSTNHTVRRRSILFRTLAPI